MNNYEAERRSERAMAAKPKTIDEYLSGVSPEKRAALEELRQTIRSIVPEAEEGFSYGMPAFRLDGKPIAGFAAAAKHCTYFPMSGSTVETLKNELKGYDTSKGAVRFQPDKPLPVASVRKLIMTRIREIEGKKGTSSGSKKTHR